MIKNRIQAGWCSSSLTDSILNEDVPHLQLITISICLFQGTNSGIAHINTKTHTRVRLLHKRRNPGPLIQNVFRSKLQCCVLLLTKLNSSLLQNDTFLKWPLTRLFKKHKHLRRHLLIFSLNVPKTDWGYCFRSYVNTTQEIAGYKSINHQWAQKHSVHAVLTTQQSEGHILPNKHSWGELNDATKDEFSSADSDLSQGELTSSASRMKRTISFN